MNKKIILFISLTGMLFLSACQKDSDIFTPNGTPTGADTNWVSTLTDGHAISQLKQLLKKENLTDSLDATIGGTVQTSAGLTVIVPPGVCVLSNGQIAAGKIYVESMLIKTKGDMILMDKPTTSFGRVLISGGEVFIRLRKESDELHLTSLGRVYVKYSDPAPSSLMKLFYGDESNLERFNWIPDSANGSSGVGITTQLPIGYEFYTNHLHWVNCDYFADSSGARINITASLAADYTNANTGVYLVFKDQKTVMGMYGDVNTRKFSSPKVPTGKQVIVISITKKGTNSYYLAHETITTGASGTSANGQVVPLTPQPTSLSDIKSYLNTL